MQLARFLAPALVLSIGVVARADDAKTYPLDAKPVYKVGEVTTATAHEENTNVTKVTTAEGAVAFAQDEKELLDFEATHKVLEVDDAGRITKELVHFSTWKRSKGDTQATELTGAHIEVSGREAKRAWKLLTPGVTLTDPTKEWLDKKFGPDEKGELGEALKPAKPVVVGESWDVEPAKIAEKLGKEMQIDAAKSSAKITLVSVEGDLATIHIELKLQVTGIAAGPGATLKVIDGGMLEMTGEGHAPLTSSARGDGGSMTMKMDTTTEAPQNMKAAISVHGKQESSTKEGGEMPEVPAAK